MLDRWLATLSKTTIAALAIAGGIFFIVMSDPPHTICDAQVEVFEKSQEGFLLPDPKLKTIKTTDFERLINQCKVANSPGGCYELFMRLKTFKQDLDNVSSECRSAVGGLSVVRTSLWQSTELMVQLAWGAKPPESYYEKFAWLDTADLSLFCDLKQKLQELYGESQWVQFRERMFRDLPGAADTPRKKVWDVMLLSANCARYP